MNPFLAWFATQARSSTRSHLRRSAERGATLVEYALVASLLLSATVGVITVIEDEAGSYLAATAEDIGEPRSLIDEYNFTGGGTFPTLTQPPAPTTTSTTVIGPNLILNGSFETPDVADGAWGLTSPPEWTSSAGSVEIWGTGHNSIASPEGAQHAELNVYGVTTYSQSVGVTSGSTYRWSVQHRGRSTTETMVVLVDDDVVAVITTPPGSWVTYTGDVQATSSTMTLAFRSISGTGAGNVVDDVKLQLVTDAAPAGRSIVAEHSGLCLTVPASSLTNGEVLVQDTCAGTTNQQWLVDDLGTGFYQLRAVHSGLCLDVNGGSTAAGAQLIQWPCHGGTNQQASLSDHSLNGVSIVMAHSSRCVDVTGASAIPGAAIDQQDCGTAGSQSWDIG
ncbi:MAG: RICIN domain-containing protein [Actinomycetota bacterium]